MNYNVLIQFCYTMACIAFGILLIPYDRLLGMELMGLINIFGNLAIFNPGFTYTEESNDISEAIAGGAYCSLIPAILYGAAIWRFGSFTYGLIASLIFIAGTIIVHYGWNKVLYRPKGRF